MVDFDKDELPIDQRWKKSHFRYDMSKVNVVDIQALVYLADTNKKYPSLKWAEEWFLGWRGASFEDTLGEAENFEYLHECFKNINKLNLTIPEGAFMYPLYIENGSQIRKKLQEQKIYIPTLWPDVFDVCGREQTEYDMAMNILPLPVDQRYDSDDMIYLAEEVRKCLN